MSINPYLKIGSCGLIIFFIGQRPLFAKDWFFSPSVNTGAVYTDNVNLSAKKQSAFVLETSPGIIASKNSEKIKLNLNYKLQNLFNASSGENNLYHLLNFNSNFQLVQNSLYLDTRASNNQQNINNNILSNSNVSGRLNRTNVTSYGFSPIWIPHFNGYAQGKVQFNYDKINTDTNAVADTTKTEQIVNISSDKKFSNKLLWTVRHNNLEQRNSANNIKFQTSEAETRLRILKDWNLFTIGGYSDNQYQTASNSFKNGAYYTVGAQWKPTQQFSIEAGYGNNSHVKLSIIPSQRLSWETTFRNKEVGINLGNTWQSEFKYQTKRSTSTVNYIEDTTTAQSGLLNQLNSASQSLNTTTSQINQVNTSINNNLASLSNDVYTRKRVNAALTYNSSKSTLTANLYDEQRMFQQTNAHEKLMGVSATWSWQLRHTMNIYISPLWQHVSRSTSDDYRHDFAIGIAQALPIRFDRKGGMNAILEYRYATQSSTIESNQFDENRLTANLFIAF